MKVLILSCNTGEGHNSAGRAIKYYFEKNGDECNITDTIAFVSPFVSRVVASGHVFLYRHMPQLFNIVYNGAEVFARADKGNRDTLIFRLLSLGAKRLYKYITDGGYDRVVCVHPFAAQMLTKVKRTHPELDIGTVFIATDYTCSPGVGESRLDSFIIPHPDVENDFTKKGVPRDRIHHIGIPIDHIYSELPSKKDARERLGIPQNDKVALIMCGSMGCGPVKRIAVDMAARISTGMSLVVICGRNEKMRKKLSARLSGAHGVRVLGFTDEMPMYMAAADLYVTKPGGLSTTESVCAHLPMLMVEAVAGCETYNLDYFTQNGYAISCTKKDDAAQFAISLLADTERLQRMRELLEKNFMPDTSYRIYMHIKELK